MREMSAIVIARRVLLHGAALAVLAAPIGVPATQSEAAEPGATEAIAPIQQLDAALLRIMQQGSRTPFSQRVSELTPVLENALDLPGILRLAVGPSWSGLSPADQSRLLVTFRQYTAATYVESFDSYDGQRLTVSPQTRALGNGAQVVSSMVISRDGNNSHTIDYVMRRMPDGAWRASDVLADGTISRVAVLRSDFAAMLASGGPSALEASLQRKTAALANG